jgi:HK97 gp10 family phage protein
MSNKLISVNVTGLDALNTKLESLGAKARGVMKAALKDGAIIVEKAMAEEAPEGEYGWLRGTMSSDPETHIKGGHDSAAVKVGPAKDLLDPTPREKSAAKPASVIAQFVELGTIHHTPNPFMTRAYERTKDEAEEAVVAKLKELLLS